jgi:hypothetical protein
MHEEIRWGKILENGHLRDREGDGKWMELAQDRIKWRGLVLAERKLRVLLPRC